MKKPDDHWMSISDLMSGLMMVFLLIAVFFIFQVQKGINDYAEAKAYIYDELYDEFKDDLPRWKADIDEKTLSIRFQEPDVLFESGSHELSPKFVAILNDFIPRYINRLYNSKYSGSIEEIRIEGHTDPHWKGAVDRQTEYLNNMNLSQLRTQAVLSYVIRKEELQDKLEWMITRMTANGLSSSQPVFVNNVVDSERSRRVEFRVRTNADEKLNELYEGY